MVRFLMSCHLSIINFMDAGMMVYIIGGQVTEGKGCCYVMEVFFFQSFSEGNSQTL